MSTGIFFLLEALFYNILLILVYFSKDRINYKENQIYSVLVWATFFEILLEFLLDIIGPNYMLFPFFANFTAKLFNVFLLSWTTLLFTYVLVISLKMLKKDYLIDKYLSYLKICTVGLSLAIFILPLKFYYEGKIAYTYGASVNVIYVMSFLYSFLAVLCLIINRKNVKDRRYLPILIFVIVGGGASFVQMKNPGLLLSVPLHAFITFFMYFTIENPDITMLEEITKARTVSEHINNEKSTFLFAITEDMNDKLNKVEKVYNKVMELNPSDEIKDNMDELKSLVITARTKINQTLDISSMDSKHLKTIDSKYNVRLILESIYIQKKKDIVNKNIDFRLNVSDTIPFELYGDSIKLKQILTTVIDNSIKYTKEGFIELRINAIQKNEMCRLVIAVEDSGSGIDIMKQNEIMNNHDELTKEDLELINDLNLNLKLIRKIIKIIGGTFTIDSNQYHGTTINITIDQKIVGIGDVAEENSIEKYSNILKDKKRLAIVSHNKTSIKYIKSAGKVKDYEIKEFNVTKHLLDEIRAYEKYDVIFIDENMEKIDARTFLKKVKAVTGFKGKVFVISKTKDIKLKKELLDFGFEGIVLSPVTKKEVLSKLENI